MNGDRLFCDTRRLTGESTRPLIQTARLKTSRGSATGKETCLGSCRIRTELARSASGAPMGSRYFNRWSRRSKRGRLAQLMWIERSALDDINPAPPANLTSRDGARDPPPFAQSRSFVFRRFLGCVNFGRKFTQVETKLTRFCPSRSLSLGEICQIG